MGLPPPGGGVCQFGCLLLDRDRGGNGKSFKILAQACDLLPGSRIY